MTDDRLIQPEDDGAAIQRKTLEYLRTHRKSYIGGNLRFGLAWNVLSFSVIVLSALTSILAALKANENVPSWLIIVLPALSALLSTFLLQFRIRDLWQLRDEGRIEIELLICKAHLIPTESRDAALNAAMELRTGAIKLELDQSRRFFSVIGQPATVRPSGTDGRSSN
ncbi:MAG: hypothetical protein ACLP1D_04785, partial [Xanthobacteraceae bacterium]